MDDIQIFEQKLTDKSKVAILVGGLNTDKPFEFMNQVVCKYCDGQKVVQFVDIKLNNPWTRLVINNLSDLPFVPYSVYLRREKLKQIEKIINSKNENNS